MISRIDRERRGVVLPLVAIALLIGTSGQKRATYRTVARPRQFTMGFELFYDEDVRRMGPAEVHRLRPDVRFVSFQ